MNIIASLIPAGRKNRPGEYNPCEYITVHNTGNADKGADAARHAAYLKGDTAAKLPVSWHYTVDDTCIYRHLPDNETAYHAGDGASGAGNAKSIGIEICMNADGDLRRASDNAAELTAELCKTHNIPVENVVQHNKWNGKNCPELLRKGEPYSFDVFIDKVREHMRAEPPDTPSAWASEAWSWGKASGITDGTSPQGICTREMLITMLHRFYKTFGL